MSKKGVSDSKLHMWRTLFSVAHADNVISDEEIKFMAEMFDVVEFSDEQIAILKDDLVNSKELLVMFDGITDMNDRIEFFNLARDLVWVDGDFASEEQSAMISLYKHHMKELSLDDLVGRVSFELENDDVPLQSDRKVKKKGFLQAILSLKNSVARR